MKVLKIKLYQPHAHYRIPFTYQRRHTYPIPPYSTVIGLLCNLLGIKNYNADGEPENEDFKKLKNIKIAICGRFESKTTEYTWFRNLSKNAHETRFGILENRYVAGHIEHIGGQSPVSIDILNEVKILIHLSHNENGFLEKIKNNFENPQNKNCPIHLGRAEDWIVIENINFAELEKEHIDGDYKHFFWIPEKCLQLEGNFNKIRGLLYKIPSFYKLENGSRNFGFVKVKLSDGDLGGIKTFFDKEENVPVFLAELK